jgi:hypothetical protein
MIKTIKYILPGVIAVITVIAIGASTFTVSASPAVDNTSAAGVNLQAASISTSDLSKEEAAGLLYMREEEKLARDVYNQMYALWGLPAFKNIAASEQVHMDRIKFLLDSYNLTDPALAPGKFSDPNLQALYDKLVAQGSTSSVEALKVGALIEQTDIADLKTRLAQTDNANIQLVYNNLMNGSYNHLAAFTGGQKGGNGQGNGQGSGGAGGQGQGGHGRPSWAGSGSGRTQP